MLQEFFKKIEQAKPLKNGKTTNVNDKSLREIKQGYCVYTSTQFGRKEKTVF